MARVSKERYKEDVDRSLYVYIAVRYAPKTRTSYALGIPL